MKKFWHTYDVTFSDIDQKFCLPINSIQGIFTDAIGRYMGTAGIGPDDLVKKGQAWMITDFSSSLHGRIPMWKDSFIVETWISELSALRCFVDYSMTDSKGRLFAEGSSTWVVIDLESRKPVPTSELQGISMLFDSLESERHKAYKFLSSGNAIGACSHQIAKTETDFNGHMNNQNYVKLALSMAPAKYLVNNVIKNFHVRFSRESFLGENLRCILEKVAEDVYLSVITRMGDGIEVCRMESQWQMV